MATVSGGLRARVTPDAGSWARQRSPARNHALYARENFAAAATAAEAAAAAAAANKRRAVARQPQHSSTGTGRAAAAPPTSPKRAFGCPRAVRSAKHRRRVTSSSREDTMPSTFTRITYVHGELDAGEDVRGAGNGNEEHAEYSGPTHGHAQRGAAPAMHACARTTKAQTRHIYTKTVDREKHRRRRTRTRRRALTGGTLHRNDGQTRPS